MFYYVACNENTEIWKLDFVKRKLRFWSLNLPSAEGYKCRIRRGAVSTCWPLNEPWSPFCSELLCVLCSKVCLLIFLPPNFFCLIPCMSSFYFVLNKCSTLYSSFHRALSSPTTFTLWCYVTVVSFISYIGLIEVSWLMSPHRLINSL